MATSPGWPAERAADCERSLLFLAAGRVTDQSGGRSRAREKADETRIVF